MSEPSEWGESVVRLALEPSGWTAEELAPARRARLMTLFGTAVLPLPFGPTAPRDVVVASLRGTWVVVE